MKPLLPFILISCLLLSACSFGQKEKISESNFELQEKCAKHANDFFKDYMGGDTKTESGVIIDFSNHYSVKLGKCFILIENGNYTNGISQNKVLIDVIERKIYGSFLWLSMNGKISLPECSMYENGHKDNEKKCSSQEEFERSIKPFMQE